MKAIVLLIFCQKLPESSKVISPINQSIGKPLQCYLPLLPCVDEAHQNEMFGNVFNLQDFEKKTKFHSSREALKIPLIHYLAYLMLICSDVDEHF